MEVYHRGHQEHKWLQIATWIDLNQGIEENKHYNWGTFWTLLGCFVFTGLNAHLNRLKYFAYTGSNAHFTYFNTI